MRETRSSGSVEGVMGNHDSYSDSNQGRSPRANLTPGVSSRSPESVKRLRRLSVARVHPPLVQFQLEPRNSVRLQPHLLTGAGAGRRIMESCNSMKYLQKAHAQC
jgi:hypothetical protein